MDLKEIKLVTIDYDSFLTELKFEIATARSEGCRLLKIFIHETLAENELDKFYFSLYKSLRFMKQKGIIKLFASSDNFQKNSTEAVFILNKFPNIIDDINAEENGEYICIMP